MSKVKDFPGIEIGTSMKPDFSCAIGLVNFRDKKLEDLVWVLLETYKIQAVAIQYENIKGIRISPNVFTSTKELDQLVEALGELTKK